MIYRLYAQLDAIRLGVRQRGLRRREQTALARLGQATLADSGPQVGRLVVLAAEAATTRSRLAALAEERRAADIQTRAELAAVPRWMVPMTIVRSVSARAVLRRRGDAIEKGLHELYLTAGRLAVASAIGPAACHVQAIRAELAATASERERRLAASDGRPLPAWMDRVRAEGKELGGAVWTQLRSQLTPKASALAGMAMGWWITSTYTDSHARSILRSVGIGHGGTHVVSGSTYKVMQFGLPLLAAAVCAYLGQRIAAAVREKAVGDVTAITPAD
jgi:hypothetical protein